MKKLIDQLEVLSEYTNVKVYEVGTDKDIARYDGRNSIPTELNEREIFTVRIENGWLAIVII